MQNYRDKDFALDLDGDLESSRLAEADLDRDFDLDRSWDFL